MTSSLEKKLRLDFINQSVLGRIIDQKRLEVLSLKSKPIGSQFVPKSTRSLRQALKVPQVGFIFEHKRSSPSAGGELSPHDRSDIIELYSQTADAISVLTDQNFFAGSLDDLAYFAQNCPQPILAKDFFIDPIQVIEARRHGADAILLMLSVLTDEGYRELSKVAKTYNLDILTEVHDEGEMQRAIQLGATIIGINNRDLKTLKVDLSQTEKLLKKAPSNALIISESGFKTHADITRFQTMVDGFLIGSSIMNNPYPQQHIDALKYGLIKVCGITNTDDASLLSTYPTSLLGLIFVPQSKRYITPDDAREIIQQVPYSYAGVFLDQPLNEVIDIARSLNLKNIQLHGKEDTNYRQHLKEKLGRDITLIQRVTSLKTMPGHCDNILLDHVDDDGLGGTGIMHNWADVSGLPLASKIIRAGGVSPMTLKDAVDLGYQAFDLCSSLEKSPGHKCPEKVDAFFKAFTQSPQHCEKKGLRHAG